MLFSLAGNSTRAVLVICLLFAGKLFAQTVSDEINSIHGNFQIDAQYYQADSLIGAPKVPEKMLTNAFGNINYMKGRFSAGIRYEAYNNVMQGFDSRYKGQGIVNRFARYSTEILDVTVGSIYEQFGSGLIFRTYYEPGLLYDNALDGFRVISSPVRGVTLKALTGRQRSFFTLGPGIVRGADGEINLSEVFDTAGKFKTKLTLGGSFVSKYQPDQDPNYNLPENVGSYGGRINIIHEGFTIFGEYVMKENDPSADNVSVANGKTYYSYKKGEALFISTSYATRGFSFLLQAKRIDNMGFRSDRDATLQNLMINYLPATTRQHTYLMPAFYPYATQPRGEVGGMAELQYKVKKGSLLGGAYGMDITLNYSQANGLKQIPVADSTSELTLYKTNYGELGDLYYHDAFIEIIKKIDKKWKLNLMFASQFYNRNVVQFSTPGAGYENIISNIGVVDLSWKYGATSVLRFEVQGLLTENKTNPNAGSWTTGMIEWNINSYFFLALIDQYNFDNPDPNRQLHYVLATGGFHKGPHRITFSAGKQRAGIFCVGGVCRNVPASNGVAVSITSSF